MSMGAGSRDHAGEWIRTQARGENLRLTLHAQAEMVDEDVRIGEVLQALGTSQVIEAYPEHRRGPCALVYGCTDAGRPLHVVCTICGECLIIITVYEPKPPKWLSPTSRSAR